MPSTDDVFSHSPNIVAHPIADEVVFVPVEENVLNAQSFFSSNEVGGRIWQLIDGQRSVKRIADIIAEEYAVAPDVALRDTGEFIATLQSKGCVAQAAH